MAWNNSQTSQKQPRRTLLGLDKNNKAILINYTFSSL